MRKTNLRRIAYCAAILFLTSCSRKPVIPDYERVLEAFNAPRGGNKPPASSTEVNIFVNLSQSMKGFASPGSNYQRVLEAVLTEAPAQRYTVKRFRFGQTVAAAENYTSGDFLTLANYSAPSASLGQLLDQIVRLRLYERLNLIFTDLVDREGRPAGPAVAPALRELAGKGVQVLLLGFRSAYQSDYAAVAFACMNRRVALKAGQSLPGSGRPFYLLVMAPDTVSMNQLHRAVLEKLRPSATFSPTAASLLLHRGMSVAVPNVLMLDQTGDKPDYNVTRRFYSSFAVPPRGEIKLPVRFTAAKTFDIDPARMSFDVTCMHLNGAAKAEGACTDTLSVSAAEDSKTADRNLVLEYSVRAPEAAGFTVYRVQMRGGVGNLPLPRWIRDWSADEDCAPAAANRTYHLGVLGDALMSNFAQDIVFAEHYIAIRRK